MQLSVYNQNAEAAGKMEVSDAVFGLPMNRDLLHQVVVSQMANKRQVVAHAKGRSEVRGGGIKPWRQKGTGRARHGSIRSPIWKGGGVTHGPLKWKDYSKKINRKMARKALNVALSSKVRDGQFIVLDAFTIDEPKTRIASKIMRSISGLFSEVKARRILLVVPSMQESNLERSMRNLPNVEMIEARNLNSLQVLNTPGLVVLKDAVTVLEKAK
jgi:large subunit ribosomal protein L4